MVDLRLCHIKHQILNTCEAERRTWRGWLWGQRERLCGAENYPFLPARRGHCRMNCKNSNKKYHVPNRKYQITNTMYYYIRPAPREVVECGWGEVRQGEQQSSHLWKVFFGTVVTFFSSRLSGKIWRRWEQTVLVNIAEVQFWQRKSREMINNRTWLQKKKLKRIHQKYGKKHPLLW